MGTFLIQGRHGTRGNFEAVIPASHGGGLTHLWRNNDNTSYPWNGPFCFGGAARYTGTTLIQSNYGSPGNLELLAVDDGGALDFFWRLGVPPWTWSGPYRIATGVRGTPALIQGRHGTKGNFEAVVPHRDGGLVHLWRNNDAGMAWSAPSRFGGGSRYVGASVIQGNFGSPGNLEAIATDEAGNLDFFWRLGSPPWTWNGPSRIATGVRGAPALIQGRHGTKGNFEAVAPHRDGGLVHLWRNNDNPTYPWSGPSRFGGGRHYAGASVIQGNFGTPGNLEVLARDDAGEVDFLWRLGNPPWTWSGPFGVGTEVSFPMSECIYGWTAAYHQAGTHVSVRIQLNPDAGIPAATMNTVRTTWRNGIIDKWTNRFDCRAANGDRKPITFDVQWVSANAHHQVRVRPGSGPTDMGNFYVNDSGDVASHEFGHMIGNPDEYPSSVCPTRSPVDTDNVMDDNTEVVARHLNRIASAHCGHSPAARVARADRLDQEVNVAIRSIDALRPALRAEVLQRLRTMSDAGSTPEGAAEAEVSFEVVGGAPGSRYQYLVAVRANGAAERQTVDQIRADREDTSGRRDVSRDLAARVFAAAEEAGLFADEMAAVGPQPLQILPDALVTIITVRDGDSVRRVVVPTAEPDAAEDLPEAAADVPLATHVQLPETSVAVLRPVLEALAAVEAAL